MAIRAKLVIIFFAFIIVPMFLLWARWQATAVESIKTVLRDSLSERAHEISDQITRTLQNHQAQVLDLTRQPALRSYARGALQSTQVLPDTSLRNDLSAFLLAHQPAYAALIGINRQGTPLFKIEPGTGPNGILSPYYADKNFSSEDIVQMPSAFADAAADFVFISDVQQSNTGTYLYLIAPLRDETNHITAALAIKLRTEQLLGEAAGPRVFTQGKSSGARPEAIILSPQGTVLYAADPAKQWRPYAEVFRDFRKPFTDLLLEADKGAEWQPWLIRHRLRESKPRLSIFMVENYSDAVGQLEFDSYVLLLLTMLLVIVAMLALYYLISGITDSIRKVTSGARAIATGNLGYQIRIKAKDETRVLAESFNRMASRLREMIRKEGEQKQFESFARLSAVLTHDLKNQILSLSLLVNNMERKFHREGFREDAMRTLSETVNNLQSLVSKMSDPRTPTKRIREKSNLTVLVERVLQRTATQATNKYKVSTQLTPELFATVDGKAIERVIENLVINALEAMPDGGTLRIVTKVENGNAIVAIADSGKGMTEEFVRDRLFHPFATTKKKGIGLGLYSCRDIVEQHNGRIEVNSRVDSGTEFRIVIPQQIEERKAEAKSATA
ncbi:MAG: HAMP domain-containing histidine kinase [Acidobacteriota bacterium]|nr:HAMP domain-containing histidine kinase [Acidobacteriota bacterium]